MAQLNGIIPVQSFELARDAIGVILTTEITAQYQMSGNAKLNATVWQERYTTFDVRTDFPAINVKIERGDFNLSKDQKQSYPIYKFIIACYVRSINTATQSADKEANLTLQKLLGMCRAILENPAYNNLGLSRPFVQETRVGAMVYGVTDETLGAENAVCGYLEFFVRVPEYVELKDPIPLLSSSTQVKLYETDEGYLWGYGVDGSLFINEDETPIFKIQYFQTEQGGDEPTMKFSELPPDTEFNADTRIIVIQPDGSGGFNNYYATPAQISSGASRKVITADATGTTITDVFFASPITGIATNNQFYIIGENFTQDVGTNSISGINISFYTGQILIAYV